MASLSRQRLSHRGQHRVYPQTRPLVMHRLARLLVCLAWVFGLGSIPATSYSAGEAQDITGAVVPILSYSDPFGNIGEWDPDGRLSSRGEFRFRVRVKNQSGDPIEGESLVVVVQRIASANYLHDVTGELEYVGAGGQMRDGKPFYRVPLGGKSELGPYAESEEFQLEIRNPNLYVIYTPVLRVYGVRRLDPGRLEESLQTLMEQGRLSPEERQRLSPPSSPGTP